MFNHLGIAPIAWTNDDLPELGKENTFEQCVSEMALAGFQGCELGNKFPTSDAGYLLRQLNLRGLTLCNAWFSTFFADGQKARTVGDFNKHMAFLKAMGAKVIGCSEQSLSVQGLKRPIFEDKPAFTDRQWVLVIEGYNELGALAEKNGMKVCLHHHMGTGVQTRDEIDRFMRSVEPAVGLLYDTGHLVYSEASQEAMLDVLEKYLPRIFHVHLKDVRPSVIAKVKAERLSFLDGVLMGAFTVPGDGAIDFKPVFQTLEDGGYHGWMVVEAEQDPKIANPLEYALKAMSYIRQFKG
jgi:inosose dehydratase